MPRDPPSSQRQKEARAEGRGFLAAGSASPWESEAQGLTTSYRQWTASQRQRVPRELFATRNWELKPRGRHELSAVRP
eukprot:393740-Prymnesium_polylepis.1